MRQRIGPARQAGPAFPPAVFASTPPSHLLSSGSSLQLPPQPVAARGTAPCSGTGAHAVSGVGGTTESPQTAHRSSLAGTGPLPTAESAPIAPAARHELNVAIMAPYGERPYNNCTKHIAITYHIVRTQVF